MFRCLPVIVLTRRGPIRASLVYPRVILLDLAGPQTVFNPR
jgi:hypothetical protein